MFIEIVVFIILVMVYCFVRDMKPPNMPPGPVDLPIIGGIPFFDVETAEKLRKKYGDIVTLRIGNMRTVMLFDFYTAKEVLSRQEITGRPFFFANLSLDDEKTGGIIFSTGLQWQHDRRFTLKNLRNLGMGKSYLEDAIHFEVQALVDDLKQYNGEPIEFPNCFRTAGLNVIWQMVASKRYDLRSKEVEQIGELNSKFQKSSAFSFLYQLFPILLWIPPFIRKLLFNEAALNKYQDEIRALLNKVIEEHERNGDLENPRDLIDEYLKGMKEEEKNGEEPKFFRRGALLQIITDLFNAGAETINTTLKWSCYLLAKHPEVALKLQSEIDAVVGRNRMVSIQDKPNLPLMEAFTIEVLRYSSMVLQNTHRRALQDTYIGKYFIPKDTLVTVSNFHVHNDPRFWKHPEKFSPERHIDAQGHCQQPKEGYMPFGLGRRQCAGEALARMEYFLFAAALIQNFSIKVPPGGHLSDQHDILLGGLRRPKNAILIYEPRHS